MRKPVIAAVNGHAVGLGLTLALQCDLRFVAEDAEARDRPGAPRGPPRRLLALDTFGGIAGLSTAADLLLTGRMIDGREAATLGLASRCLPADSVPPQALEVAREIARYAGADVGRPLQGTSCGREWSADRPGVGGEAETELHHHVMGRADAVEGVMAFLERRPPRFRAAGERGLPDGPRGLTFAAGPQEHEVGTRARQADHVRPARAGGLAGNSRCVYTD